MTSFIVPIRPGLYVRVEGAFPMSVADWEQFEAVLDAMKPGLVSAPSEEDPT